MHITVLKKQIYGEAISESWPRKYVLTYLLSQDSLTDNIVLSVTENKPETVQNNLKKK